VIRKHVETTVTLTFDEPLAARMSRSIDRALTALDKCTDDQKRWLANTGTIDDLLSLHLSLASDTSNLCDK